MHSTISELKYRVILFIPRKTYIQFLVSKMDRWSKCLEGLMPHRTEWSNYSFLLPKHFCHICLDQWFSTCGPQTSSVSISIVQEVVRNAVSKVLSQNFEIRNSRGGICVLTSLPGSLDEGSRLRISDLANSGTNPISLF